MGNSDDATLRDAGIEQDANFKAPLSRVNYQPGMLLGVEATRGEQEYHRLHLLRHSYWLHGAGTVVGLRVRLDSIDPIADDDLDTRGRVRLVVTPGIGVDGLGREVTLDEPYCIDIGEWLSVQYSDAAGWDALQRDGLTPDKKTLWLKVTMRYQETGSAFQPVMGTGVNAGTDPVAPSRLKDCVLLELVAERPDAAPQKHPFASHNALRPWEEVEQLLSPADRQKVDAADEASRRQLELAARLLHALPEDNQALTRREALSRSAAEIARTLLARLSVRLTDDEKLIVNPHRIEVHNLGRPFLFNAALTAQLMQS